MINFLLAVQQAISLFINSSISVIKVLFLSKFSVRKVRAGSPYCGVLGNGPSLKTSLQKDLAFIKKLELFAVNLFSVTPEYIELKPKNYLILDMSFLNPAHSCQDGLKAMANLTTWEMNLYVPYQMLKSAFFVSQFRANPNIRLIPYNYTIVTGYRWLAYWFFRRGLGMPQCQNVLVATLFYAINMGFKEIYLFGADHSWHEMIKLDENNNMVVSDSHFYQHKDIDIAVKENSYMSQQLFSLHKAFYGYEVLGKYAKSLGIKIYNASAKSYIDVFEKVKVADLPEKR
ncbi:hypothetical protein [Emticicia agri]|uniref:DUF115 domain-containing protein n=1 Tax=Emticicia agri TaxID=2492393 RepID=A0A4Q5M3P5_9BACT|nr:hypothetical protein [Emticicia agri]RYU97016.1 hypothetical protein EWM59_03650 [Emticicia agri]